jgi:hypothetical protein
MISNFARRVGDKDKKKRKSKSLIDGISAIGITGSGYGLGIGGAIGAGILVNNKRNKDK